MIEAIRQALASAGLNLIGVASADAYDAGVPARYRIRNLHAQAVSIIVIGNAGPALWNAVTAARPATGHPIDDYTRDCITARVAPLLISESDCRIYFPFEFERAPLSFMHLGVCAGLGVPSLLGMLIHPQYGPWIALRAAITVCRELPANGALDFAPCATCADKPCMAHCPGAAITAAGWDIPACAAHRLRAADHCAEACSARRHCVYGQPYAYPPAAQRHHQRFSRQAMEEHAT